MDLTIKHEKWPSENFKSGAVNFSKHYFVQFEEEKEIIFTNLPLTSDSNSTYMLAVY